MRLEVRREWGEMDFGDWEGLTWPEIEARDPEFAARWLRETESLACPGGESAQGFEARVRAALDGLLEEFAGRTLVLSGHAGTSRVVLASVLGMRYLEAFRFVQDFGCLNACAWDAGSGSVALVNFVPGPRSKASL
jgi:broad specificity phosphatase PhoE